MISQSRDKIAYIQRFATLPLMLMSALFESSYTHFRAALGWIKYDLRQAWIKHWDTDH